MGYRLFSRKDTLWSLGNGSEYMECSGSFG
nr:MAG TPA: hypothetical protein [Caudoviricetes sp.]